MRWALIIARIPVRISSPVPSPDNLKHDNPAVLTSPNYVMPYYPLFALEPWLAPHLLGCDVSGPALVIEQSCAPQSLL